MDGLIPLATRAAFLGAWTPDVIWQQVCIGAPMLHAAVGFCRRGVRSLQP